MMRQRPLDSLDVQITLAKLMMERRPAKQPHPPVRRRRQAGETLDQRKESNIVIRRKSTPGTPKKVNNKRFTSNPSWWKSVFGCKNLHRLAREKYGLDNAKHLHKHLPSTKPCSIKHLQDQWSEEIQGEVIDEVDSEEHKNLDWPLDEDEEDVNIPVEGLCEAEGCPEWVILSPGWQGPGDAVLRRRNMKNMQLMRLMVEDDSECVSEEDTTISSFTSTPQSHTKAAPTTPCIYARSYCPAHTLPTTPGNASHNLTPNPPFLTPYINHPSIPSHTPSNNLPHLTPHTTSFPPVIGLRSPNSPEIPPPHDPSKKTSPNSPPTRPSRPPSPPRLHHIPKCLDFTD